MVHHLYANFLENKKVYNLVQGYWQRLFSGLANERRLQFAPYLNPTTRAGQKDYDGNPIFDAWEKTLNRAVRIIQVAPQGEQLDVSAWLDSIELPETLAPIPELVIDLALSKESYALAERLISAWLTAGTTKEGMVEMIEREVLRDGS